MGTLTQFAILAIALSIGLAIVIGTAYRANVGNNWEQYRCDPSVQAIAAFFKPSGDTRSSAQFAHDNWVFCQREFVQNAIRLAAAPAKDLADAATDTISMSEAAVGAVADVFAGVWEFCHQAYSSFMESMGVVARQFQNLAIRLSSAVDQLHATVLSTILGLLSLIITIVNSVQLTLIVVVVVIGIIIALEIILFFLLMPISGLIITVSAIVSVAVVVIATAIAATEIAEMFSPGVCFAPDTVVQMGSVQGAGPGAGAKPLSEVGLGERLADGGFVTAVHRFWTRDAYVSIHGVRVTGDHLVAHPDYPRRLMFARDHPAALSIPDTGFWNGLWGLFAVGGSTKEVLCLTTTTRRIPCAADDGTVVLCADWEEIPANDDEQLASWYADVWTQLNGPDAELLPRPTGDAGLAPDTLVAVQDWTGRRVWRRVEDVRVGDRVFDRWNRTTGVVGTVTMTGDQSTDAFVLTSPEHGPQIVSAATWIRMREGYWLPAASSGSGGSDTHPARWFHLYTASGEFQISGGWCVRDASEVGLENLHDLVEDVVLLDAKYRRTG